MGARPPQTHRRRNAGAHPRPLREREETKWQSPSPSPSPIASPSAATPAARPGPRPAAAGSSSTPPPRSPATNGSPSPRRRAWPRVRAFSPQRRSISPRSRSLFGDRIETRRSVRFDPATGGVQALRERRLGAIRLSSGPDSNADPEEIAAALLEGVQHGRLVAAALERRGPGPARPHRLRPRGGRPGGRNRRSASDRPRRRMAVAAAHRQAPPGRARHRRARRIAARA